MPKEADGYKKCKIFVTFHPWQRFYSKVDSFAEFYSENRKRLFAYLVRLSGEGELARDLLQESFAKYLERYGRETLSKPLLFTIARNAFFDVVRKRKKYPEAAPETDPAGPDPDPEAEVLVREAYRRVVDAFQQLEMIEREVLSLVISSGLNYRDVAETVGISEANVKVRVHRARQKLHEILKAG
jgi:RNA polymerase sigma-70 factor (ECF subfamily)